MVYNSFKPRRAHIFVRPFFVARGIAQDEQFGLFKANTASVKGLYNMKGTIAMENIKETGISSTLKEYLDVIYDISRTGLRVRTTDIARKLGISKPSVNRAVGTLKAKGYVTHEPYGAVLLTDKGRAFGENSGSRNRIVKKFLINVLSLTDDEAEREAVSIAHSISFVTAEKMRSYMSQ